MIVSLVIINEIIFHVIKIFKTKYNLQNLMKSAFTLSMNKFDFSY